MAEERVSELNRVTPVGSSYLTPENSSVDARVPSLSLIIPQNISCVSHNHGDVQQYKNLGITLYAIL